VRKDFKTCRGDCGGSLREGDKSECGARLSRPYNYRATVHFGGEPRAPPWAILFRAFSPSAKGAHLDAVVELRRVSRNGRLESRRGDLRAGRHSCFAAKWSRDLEIIRTAEALTVRRRKRRAPFYPVSGFQPGCKGRASRRRRGIEAGKQERAVGKSQRRFASGAAFMLRRKMVERFGNNPNC
jgi:hypothetical protein